jgi:hypothetical protein
MMLIVPSLPSLMTTGFVIEVVGSILLIYGFSVLALVLHDILFPLLRSTIP